MADFALKVVADQQPIISLVRGEDRTIGLAVLDNDSKLPLALTDYDAIFAVRRWSSGSIKRRTNGLVVDGSTGANINGATFFTVVSHGLVDGETVTLTAEPGALPLGLSAEQSYQVILRTDDLFGLQSQGQKVQLASPASGLFRVVGGGAKIVNASLGQIAVYLPSIVTGAMAAGQGISWQLTLLDADGMARIFVAQNALDVYDQPCP